MDAQTEGAKPEFDWPAEAMPTASAEIRVFVQEIAYLAGLHETAVRLTDPEVDPAGHRFGVQRATYLRALLALLMAPAQGAG